MTFYNNIMSIIGWKIHLIGNNIDTIIWSFNNIYYNKKICYVSIFTPIHYFFRDGKLQIFI